MLCGCRWYFDEQIKIELATKNGSFVHIKDPISFPEFEQVNFKNNLECYLLFANKIESENIGNHVTPLTCYF